MTLLTPKTEAELLAIVLCPARVFGQEEGVADALRAMKATLIRRFKISRRV